MRQYLTHDEMRRVTSVFEDKGYKSQTDIARKLVRMEGPYEGRSELSIRSYLTQVLNGCRPPSTDLIDALKLLCDNDERLSFLEDVSSRTKTNQHVHWRGLLKDYLTRITEGYIASNESGRLNILGKLEEIVKQFEE